MSNGYGDHDQWTAPEWSGANGQGVPADPQAYPPQEYPQQAYPQPYPQSGYPQPAYPQQPYAPQPYGQAPYQPNPYQQNPYLPAGAPQAPYSGNVSPGMGSPWMSYKPGIVNLRPMDLGEILGGAFKLIRFNPKSTIGLSLVVQLFVLALGLLAVLFGHGAPRVGGDASDAAGSLSRALTSLLTQASGTVLGGLLAYVVAEAVLGRKPGLGQTWRATRRRLLPFIGQQLILWFGIVLVIALVVGAGLLTWSVSNSTGATVLVCLLLGLVALVAFVWLSVRFMLSGVAIIMEQLGPIGGFRRSWRLTRGRFWPILGTQIVGGMIAGFASSVLTFPIAMIIGLAASNGSNTTGAVAATLVAEAIAMVLVGPFSAGIVGLLYVDQRIRKEGFDLTLQQCADQGSSPWPVDKAQPVDQAQSTTSGYGR